MANPRISDPSDDELLVAIAALEAHGGNRSAAARSLSLKRNTYNDRLKLAEKRGLKEKSPASLNSPNGMVPERVSINYIDGEERQRWEKFKAEDQRLEDVIAYIKESFADFKPKSKLHPAPKAPRDEILNLIPLSDFHLGLYCWRDEVGENWDLRIAEERLSAGISDVIASAPSCGTAIVLGGGDLMHSDSDENRTRRSGHALDVDGRYAKVLDSAQRLVVHTIDIASQKHENVIVRVLPGNHDERSALAIAYFLKAWYRESDRITVDVDPSLFFWHRFGKVLLGATHGHTVKIKEMPSIMAHRRAEDWGQTKHRFVHGFHLHHTDKIATEGGGVICEVHQSPAPQDSYNFGSGYLAGRSLTTITYHHETGQYARNWITVE